MGVNAKAAMITQHRQSSGWAAGGRQPSQESCLALASCIGRPYIASVTAASLEMDAQAPEARQLALACFPRFRSDLLPYSS